jgi:hypothetical protein
MIIKRLNKKMVNEESKQQTPLGITLFLLASFSDLIVHHLKEADII